MYTTFKAGDKEFYVVIDREEKLAAALAFAKENGIATVEEYGKERLNMYVGPPNFGPDRLVAVHPVR